MKPLKHFSYLLAGIAVLLLIAAICLGIAIGFDHTAAIGCLAAAFASAVIGAALSVIWKSSKK